MKNYIPDLIKDKGISITALANLSGVSRSIVSELANSDSIPGKTRFDILLKIAACLNADSKDLFSYDYNLSIISNQFLNKTISKAPTDRAMKLLIDGTLITEYSLITLKNTPSNDLYTLIAKKVYNYKKTHQNRITLEFITDFDYTLLSRMSNFIENPIDLPNLQDIYSLTTRKQFNKDELTAIIKEIASITDVSDINIKIKNEFHQFSEHESPDYTYYTSIASQLYSIYIKDSHINKDDDDYAWIADKFSKRL